MMDVNLLPWRLLAYQKKQRILHYGFWISLGSAFVLFVTLHCFFQGKIEKEKIKIGMLHSQLLKIEGEYNKIMKLQQEERRINHAVQFFKKVEKEQNNFLNLINKIQNDSPEEIDFSKIDELNFQFQLQISKASDTLFEKDKWNDVFR